MGTQSMTAAGQRETALLNLYRLERRAGSDPLTANQAVHDYAKRLDRLEEDYQADLNIIRQCMERAS